MSSSFKLSSSSIIISSSDKTKDSSRGRGLFSPTSFYFLGLADLRNTGATGGFSKYVKGTSLTSDSGEVDFSSNETLGLSKLV